MISLMKDTRGAIAILTAFLLIPLVAIVGLAVDSARAYSVRAQIQVALDSAALAGGRQFYMPAATRDTTIRAFFRENLSTHRYGATVNPNALQIAANIPAGTLTLSIQGTMPVTLIGVLGFNTVNVGTSTQIIRNDTTLELALALDVSNSMNNNMGTGTRLSALKTAANSLLDILMPNGNDPAVQISIVPWNNAVFLNPANAANWATTTPPPSWNGVFRLRSANDLDLVDMDPISVRFVPYTLSSNLWSVRRVLPLSPNRGLLNGYIMSLTANGNTNSAVGISWAWNTISPNWRGQWNGVAATSPRDYGAPNNIKAMVLMTDGENTQSIPAYNVNQPTQWMDNRSLQMCTNMRNVGIRIYTIGLSNGLLGNAAAVNLLRNCASSPGNFFAAPDAATLNAAFRAIASDLAALRITR